MAWSDAARAAAAEARRRKAKGKAGPRSLRSQMRLALERSSYETNRIAMTGTYSGRVAEQANRNIGRYDRLLKRLRAEAKIGSRAHRLIDPGFAATMHPGQRALSGLPRKK